jgi:hypothetical protein
MKNRLVRFLEWRKAYLPRESVGSKGLGGLRASVFFGEGPPLSPCAGAALRFGVVGLLRELR